MCKMTAIAVRDPHRLNRNTVAEYKSSLSVAIATQGGWALFDPKEGPPDEALCILPYQVNDEDRGINSKERFTPAKEMWIAADLDKSMDEMTAGEVYRHFISKLGKEVNVCMQTSTSGKNFHLFFQVRCDFEINWDDKQLIKKRTQTLLSNHADTGHQDFCHRAMNADDRRWKFLPGKDKAYDATELLLAARNVRERDLRRKELKKSMRKPIVMQSEITPEIIQEIKDRVSISDVADMHSSGCRNKFIWCHLCDVPGSGKPTAHIYESKGREAYKCFSCNDGGDVIAYYMNVKGCDFITACKDLMGRN